MSDEDREELQDVLASIAQLGDRAPDALKAAAHAKTGLTPDKPTSPGVRYTEEIDESDMIGEEINEDN